MNYYPFHIGDYASHTMHLEPLEDLAYRRMLDVYYTRDGALPTDVADVARLIRMRSNIDLVKTILEEFFEPVPAGWRHARCEIELSKMLEKQDSQREKANRMWEKKRQSESGIRQTPETVHANASKNHATAYATASNPDANAMPPTPTPTPTPIKNTSAVAPPDGVVESVWADFVDLRKSKKAKLTKTALDGIKAEAEKAGWSLEAALRECCCRGWTGFKADWVIDKNTTTSETAYQKSMRLRVAEFAPSIARQAPGAPYPIENMTLEASNVTAITRA